MFLLLQSTAVVEILSQQLAQLQEAMHLEVENAVRSKSQQLLDEYQGIMSCMKQVVKDCNVIGKPMLFSSNY